MVKRCYRYARTTRVSQLFAALAECRDQVDICDVFEDQRSGLTDYEIACRRLGISKADWDYAISEGGFYFLVGIIGEKLGLPRYDPAAEEQIAEEIICG